MAVWLTALVHYLPRSIATLSLIILATCPQSSLLQFIETELQLIIFSCYQWQRLQLYIRSAANFPRHVQEIRPIWQNNSRNCLQLTQWSLTQAQDHHGMLCYHTNSQRMSRVNSKCHVSSSWWVGDFVNEFCQDQLLMGVVILTPWHSTPTSDITPILVSNRGHP